MEQTNDTNAAPATSAVAASDSAVLAAPKMITFFKEGWDVVKTRKDLVGWYIAVLVLFSALSTELVFDAINVSVLPIVYGITFFIATIFLIINAWTLIHAVSQPDIADATYKQSFHWASSNFFPLLWTSILVGLAVLLGYIVLIIPGVILSFYLYFSLYAHAMGDGMGTKALKRSYRDVKGRWWKTVWKLFVLGFYIMLVYLVAAIVIALLSVIGNENTYIEFISTILLDGLVGGVVGVISIYAVAQYYKYLRATASTPEAEPVQTTEAEPAAG